PRSAPASALPEIPAGLLRCARIRYAATRHVVRCDEGLPVGHGCCFSRDAGVACTRSALPVAVWRAVEIPLQDGLRRSRIYVASAQRGQGSLQLPRSRLADEARDGETGARTGAADRGHAPLD